MTTEATPDHYLWSASGSSTFCTAAAQQLYFFANGDVGPCCRTTRPYGNVGTRSLHEIWFGADRRERMDRLARGDLGGGCDVCDAVRSVEGRPASDAVLHDHWSDALGIAEPPRWPARMEFELSNRCNLRCVQCNGDLSSAIRSRREHRPPLPAAYTDAFFEQLRDFLPHLRHASFTGGEPFLAEENFRVWDLIAELAPGLPCTIVTNATQWTPRVERVLESLEVHPVISLDGATPQVYESVRIGARFDAVMANIDRLCAYAQRRGTSVAINMCLMPATIAELPAMLRAAEARGIHVNAQIVRSPAHLSVAQMDEQRLDAVRRDFEDQDAELQEGLRLNLATWRTELARLRSWTSGGDQESPVRWVDHSPRILMFSRKGEGPTDIARVAADLDEGGRRQVHAATVGADESVRHCSEGFAAVFGLDVAEIEDSHLGVLQGVITRYEVLEESPDRYEATFRVGARSGRLVMVPSRDAVGRADEVALFAVTQGPSGSDVP